MAELLQAGCPSSRPTKNVKTVKDDSVPDLGQHAATMGEEHYNGCVDCLALRIQGSFTPVTTTVFLTWKQTAITTKFLGTVGHGRFRAGCSMRRLTLLRLSSILGLTLRTLHHRKLSG